MKHEMFEFMSLRLQTASRASVQVLFFKKLNLIPIKRVLISSQLSQSQFFSLSSFYYQD